VCVEFREKEKQIKEQTDILKKEETETNQNNEVCFCCSLQFV